MRAVERTPGVHRTSVPPDESLAHSAEREDEIEVDSGFAEKPLDLDLNLDLHKTFAQCK